LRAEIHRSDIVSPLAGETSPKAKPRDREGVIAVIHPPLCPTGQEPVGLSLPLGERRNQKRFETY